MDDKTIVEHDDYSITLDFRNQEVHIDVIDVDGTMYFTWSYAASGLDTLIKDLQQAKRLLDAASRIL